MRALIENKYILVYGYLYIYIKHVRHIYTRFFDDAPSTTTFLSFLLPLLPMRLYGICVFVYMYIIHSIHTMQIKHMFDPTHGACMHV